jgi:hypothetical protein
MVSWVFGLVTVVGMLGAVAGPAGAQTGDIPAFCAARLEANSAHTKAENKAVIEKVYNAAPAAAVAAITAIRDGFNQKGDKFFETTKGAQALSQLDAVVYANCPGTSVPVTAIDYEFQGVPATLPAGAAKFKLTNTAPKEDHEMAVLKLNAEGESLSIEKLLALPEKKAQKYFDESASTFMFAPAGQTGYGFVTLEPGKYAYACFLSQGGKKNGKPHFMLGMQGSFTVS